MYFHVFFVRYRSMSRKTPRPGSDDEEFTLDPVLNPKKKQKHFQRSPAQIQQSETAREKALFANQQSLFLFFNNNF